MNLYDKEKKKQWDSAERIDWSLDVDPENPEESPDKGIPIFGTDFWNKMTKQEKANLRRHVQAHRLSQFLHGEQGALICTAKIVQQVPNTEAKFSAATQAMDNARHVESYSRLLHVKAERDEREEFVVEACYLMRDRFLAEEMWERVGFSSADLLPLLDRAESMVAFRNRLFTRIVSAIKQIGLWGPIVKTGYEQMGIMEFADIDADALSADDEAAAERFDADMLRN